ncbi:hypothetical protein QYM36_002760 [Artemia franciscana]|uniref:Uncharacterized protein n=1 Tax=Artemia franciscana TaxID=6661 RepID=A0AA88I5S6_ARTSF|nr:hypothetical protein QYM36_002760 [Artemia franciscana]
MCVDRGLIVDGSLFPHREVHKYTCTSPDGVTRSKIDSLLIRKRHRCFKDVHSNRGAELFFDHQLVIARFKLKLKTIVKCKRTLRTFDLQKIKDKDIRQNYCLFLTNKFPSLVCEERTESVCET